MPDITKNTFCYRDILNDIYNDCSRENEQKSPPHFGRQDTFFNSPVDFMSEFEVMFNNFFKGFPAIAFGPPAGMVFAVL